MRDMIDCRVRDDRGRPKVPDHISSDMAMAEVREAHGVREITDQTAVTIASWWQSPGREGCAFAQLSTTGMVEPDMLAYDIAGVHKEASPDERLALDMLSTWGLHHISRA